MSNQPISKNINDVSRIQPEAPILETINKKCGNEMRRMHTMLQRPSCSGWIILLQNRVVLHCEENQRNSVRVFYDKQRRSVGPSPEECHILFHQARLKDGKVPTGWIEE